MNCYVFAAPQVLCYVNDNTASIDQHWVDMTLLFLQSNMVAASLVKRDFEDMIQDHGDIINVRRQQDFVMRRTADFVNLDTQDAVSNKIQVPLDQWATVSFLIGDGERSKSFANLANEYLEPAAIALGEAVDKIVLGQVARLSTNFAGELNAMNASNAQRFLVETDKALNDSKCPQVGRQLILSTNAKAQLLQSSIVVEADKRGDEGTALREASVGRIYGFQTWMDQNVNSVDPSDTDSTAFVTGTVAYAKGYTGDIAVTTNPTGQVVGEYVVIEGEGHAHVLSATGTAPDDITLVDPLKRPVAAGSDVTIYNSALANGAQSLGAYGLMNVDGLASGKPLQIGQLLAHGTGGSRKVYTIIDIVVVSATEVQVQLDRPLETAWADNDVLFPGPAGDMNVAMHSDAVALVVRPLATVPEGEGARSFVASFGGLSIRMTATYDGLAHSTRVTLDLLCGVQILDARLACIMYS